MISGRSDRQSASAAALIEAGSGALRCATVRAVQSSRGRHGENVDRHRDVHGPGPGRGEDRKSLTDQFEHVVGAERGGAERGQRLGHSLLARNLVQASPSLSQGPGCIPARDHEYRNGVGVGLPHRRRGVGDTGARDQGADPGPAARAGIAVRHEARSLLASWLYVIHVAVGDASVDIQRVHARNAEDGVYVVLRKQADERLSACSLLRHRMRLFPPGSIPSVDYHRWPACSKARIRPFQGRPAARRVGTTRTEARVSGSRG